VVVGLPFVVPIVAPEFVRRGVDGDANEPFPMWKIEIPLHVVRCVMGKPNWEIRTDLSRLAF